MTLSKLAKLPTSRVRNFLLIAIFLMGSFSGGYLLGVRNFTIAKTAEGNVHISRELPQDKQDLDFVMFWQVWDKVARTYYDPSQIHNSALVYGAIQGMVAAVGDPYTIFLPPQQNKVTSEDLSGQFEGVGIQIGFRGNQIAVIAPLPGSPAEKAGIKSGDFIVGIRDIAKDLDRSTVGMTLPEAVQAIRGPAGSTVTLALLRDGSDNPLVVDVQRQSIDVPSVSLEFVGTDKSVAHIRLLKFGEDTKDEWDKAVLEILKQKNLSGIVLDMRGNPGGLLYGAVDLAGEFMEMGQVVVIEERSQGAQENYKVDRIGRLLDEDLVVLIDGGSASASEILAGALRDDLSTKLIGQKSFGKGTIQEREELLGGVALHITAAKWLTPKGTWVHENGLVPDIEIQNDSVTSADEQLDAAVKYILSL